MKAKIREIFRKVPLLALVFIILFIAGGCGGSSQTEPTTPTVSIQLTNPNGPVIKIVSTIEVGDSLAVGVKNVTKNKAVSFYLTDNTGKEWSYAKRFADKNGEIDPALFWYHTGVIGTTSKETNFKPDPAFVTFEEALSYFNQHSLSLAVKDTTGKVLVSRNLTVKQRLTPFIFPSNKDGVLMNSFDQQSEDIYVTGKNFPAASTIYLLVVKNKYTWNVGDQLTDISGPNGGTEIETVTLESNQTQFTIKIWDHSNGIPGSYDIIARVGDAITGVTDFTLKTSDILSYNQDTGFIYYRTGSNHISTQAAGQGDGITKEFQFKDLFEKNTDIFCAIDPIDVPTTHRGGNYAAFYIVQHQDAAYWDSTNPRLNDVTGGVEIRRIKYGSLNSSLALIWPDATQSQTEQEYDVIIDFGSRAAQKSTDFAMDNIYNKGTDIIDSYGTAGFKISSISSTAGPYPVGTVELNEPNGIDGISDPDGITGPRHPIVLAWARIMYPAVSAGTGTPINTKETKYPIALFLHGRHYNCDDDGSGPGLVGSYSFNCPEANRIPSHEGFNYIMEELASHGIFCISISAHDIQPGLGSWDYEARGKLILKYLDKLRDWNDKGTDPFGGLFKGKLDLSKIALSGHSRGGEGVVAAQELNITWPKPHSIVAVNAIAPTDQNSYSYQMTKAPYFLIVGARDGDVYNMQGFRTYDRAYPDKAPMRYPKTVAFVHGANHNYFNTIWTDTAALGSANPWAGSRDDAGHIEVLQKMSAKDQRNVARVTISAFFRRHLLGIEENKEILTGHVKPEGIPNQYIYWTYQDSERTAVDNYEQLPQDKTKNTMQGTASVIGFSHFYEILLNHDSSDYDGMLENDDLFYHDTLGLRLSWSEPSTYTTTIPADKKDVSTYTYLTIRVGLLAANINRPFHLNINLEDTKGHTLPTAVRSDEYDIVPRPYARDYPANQVLMTGVRIPLSAFTANNSNIDLKNITKITISVEGTGGMGIDDIEFSK